MLVSTRLNLTWQLLVRVLNAAQYMVIKSSDRHRSAQIRISKTAAVLVGFYICHSLPNILLVSKAGRQRYAFYGSFHACCLTTRFIETFLFGAGILHVLLAIRKGSSSRKDMLITGSVVLGLLVSHLLDFRFNRPSAEETKSLDETVLKTVNRKKIVYSLFVVAVAVHAWRGATKAWLFRLGFRQKAEIQFLHRLCRSLILVSASVYHIPISQLD